MIHNRGGLLFRLDASITEKCLCKRKRDGLLRIPDKLAGNGQRRFGQNQAAVMAGHVHLRVNKTETGG
jgi:hypothetical protein